MLSCQVLYEYKSKTPYVQTNYGHGKITHDASSTMALSRNADKVRDVFVVLKLMTNQVQEIAN